jgi:hypothetical protein
VSWLCLQCVRVWTATGCSRHLWHVKVCWMRGDDCFCSLIYCTKATTAQLYTLRAMHGEARAVLAQLVGQDKLEHVVDAWPQLLLGRGLLPLATALQHLKESRPLAQVVRSQRGGCCTYHSPVQ